MKTFYSVLVNTLVASSTNNFLWFALVFWVYLETKSVILSSIVGATFPLISSLFGIAFGTFVDHHLKKTAMMWSTGLTIGFFSLAALVYYSFEHQQLLDVSHPGFWLFLVFVMAGALSVNLRMIAQSTLVTILVPQKKHDHANGLVGTINGMSFAITSVFSGLAIAYLGMGWSILLSIAISLLAFIHLSTIRIKERLRIEADEPVKRFDLQGANMAVSEIAGLRGLIFFSMINNFLGGAFFALMDPYGLELVSVQVWGFIWGGLSLAFIVGGLLVARFGLSKQPLQDLFLANICMWIIGMLFPLQASILFVIVGMATYMLLVPRVEAAEQTILQKVVPLKKQGRVFGFAQTLETLASPIMAIIIGPLAHWYFIPLMTDGWGAKVIGPWFGMGVNRGIGLVFIVVSLLGLLVTFFAFKSSVYQLLSEEYRQS